MTVEILLFSVLRDLAGTDRIALELEGAGADLGLVLERAFALHPALGEWRGPLLLAVNGDYADRGTPVVDGDEIALMPPVQGG